MSDQTSIDTTSNHVHNEHHTDEQHNHEQQNHEQNMSATTLGSLWDKLNTRQLVLRSKQGEPFLTIPFKILLIIAAIALVMPWLIIPSVVLGSIVFILRNVRPKLETIHPDVNTPSDLAS